MSRKIGALSARDVLTEWAIEHEVDLLFLDPPEVFDKCIVGIVTGKCQEPAVLYDEQKVIAAIRNSSTPRVSWDDALEHFCVNTSDAWHGENTWRFVTTVKQIRGG